jgi:hypothetical protein
LCGKISVNIIFISALTHHCAIALQCMTARQKLTFLQQTFIQKLREIDPSAKANFGKMNVQQMVEHMSYAVRVAGGKLEVPAITPEDKLEKYYKWLMSDEQFKPSTPNSLLPETPAATKCASLGDAIDDLEDDIQAFVDFYKGEPTKKVLNAFYGELDYYEQVQLLYKHSKHHLAQFTAA